MSSRHLQDLRVTPQGSSAFEHLVRRLGLTPSKYARSAELKEWVRKNKDSEVSPFSLRTPPPARAQRARLAPTRCILTRYN